MTILNLDASTVKSLFSEGLITELAGLMQSQSKHRAGVAAAPVPAEPRCRASPPAGHLGSTGVQPA